MFKPLPTRDRLECLYHYDAQTGDLISKRSGKPIRNIDAGYYRVCVNQELYYVHRIVWFLEYGEDPGDELIDHIDQNRTNNRISNLRMPGRSTNRANSKLNSDNSSGYRNVYKTRNGTFQAAVRRNGKLIHFGTFKTAEEASAAIDLEG